MEALERKVKTRVLLGLLLWAGLTLEASGDPLPSASPEPILPDPVPNPKIYFPPQSATSNVADPGKALGVVDTSGGHACNALNPCALPPPQLNGK